MSGLLRVVAEGPKGHHIKEIGVASDIDNLLRKTVNSDLRVRDEDATCYLEVFDVDNSVWRRINLGELYEIGTE